MKGHSVVLKRAAVLIALALYVAASAWLVRSEGDSYRRSLRRNQVARVADPPRTVAGGAGLPNSIPAAVSPPAIISKAPTPVPLPAPIPTGPPSATVAAPAPPSPITPSPSFWDSPEFKKTWDLDKLSAEEEMQFGQGLHDVILTFNPPVRGGPWLRRVEEAAEEILKARVRQDIRYTFTVLEGEEVNAFSHPGGFVYVSRGLFDLIGKDEDFILQFVLAHEIAHVDMRHMQACLADKGVKALKRGTIETCYAIVIPFGYTDAQEAAADRWAFDQMLRLDHSRLEALTFLLRFEDYAKAREFESGRDHRAIRDGTALVENHYRSHPGAYKRLKALKAPASAPAPPARPR